jgi:probable HAF family extracellular repeat protein
MNGRTRAWLCVSIMALMIVQASAQNPTNHAFFWSAADGMHDLGSLGGSSYAYAINNAGQVVGCYESSPGNFRAFLWTESGGTQDLGTLGGDSSAASGINSQGQVVGWSVTSTGDAHAFLWTASTGMQDLGTLGGSSSDATAINDRGEITGSSAKLKDIQAVAYRETPTRGMRGLGTLG